MAQVIVAHGHCSACYLSKAYKIHTLKTMAERNQEKSGEEEFFVFVFFLALVTQMGS